MIIYGKMSGFKQYIGDGVYAGFDGYHVVLTTENGISATNTIALESEVLTEFDNYREWLKQKIEEISNEQKSDNCKSTEK